MRKIFTQLVIEKHKLLAKKITLGQVKYKNYYLMRPWGFHILLCNFNYCNECKKNQSLPLV